MKKIENKQIREPEYRPKFKTFKANGNFPKDLLMGFEMEMDRKGEWDLFDPKIRRIINNHEFLYAKEDGSVSGCEVNTHPFNWNWYIKNNPLKCVSSLHNFARASRDCGFHIHLSRKYFTKTHLAKMVSLFYNNQDFIRQISQRNNMEYCNTELPLFNYYNGNREVSRGNCMRLARIWRSTWDGCWHRYMALNLCSHPTIEIRIFQGTLNRKLIKAYLEFAMACTLYTENTNFNDVSVDGLKKFVRVNKSKFPFLFKTQLLNKKCRENWNKCA